MRVRWWLVFLVVGAVLIALGITLMGGLGQALVAFLGIAVMGFWPVGHSEITTIVVSCPFHLPAAGRPGASAPDGANDRLAVARITVI